MDAIDPAGTPNAGAVTGPGAVSTPPLTAAQQAALTKLHTSAQQLEGVFIGMLFKEMRKASPDTSITGKVSDSEKTFNEMLDQERADKLAQSGSLGFAKIIEQQLRASVLASAGPGPGAARSPLAMPVLPPVLPLPPALPKLDETNP